MYCPKCKQEFPGKFCPECGERLIEEPLQNDINLNLSDKAAVLGGLNVMRNDSHNTTNLDQSVTYNSYVTNTVKKSDTELHHERIQMFMECCSRVFHNGLIIEEEKNQLETERIRLGINETDAARLIEQARKSSGGRMTTLSTRDATTLKNIDRYIDNNNITILQGQIPRLAALVSNYNIEEILFKNYMLLAAIEPKELIKKYETNTADEYWQTYWVAVAYMKYDDNNKSEEAIVKLDLYHDYPEDNSLLLSALSTYHDYGGEEAVNYISAVLPEQCSPLLMPFIQSLFLVITPERAAEIAIDKQKCRFYLENLINLENPEAKRKAEEEAIRRAEEEAKRKAEEERRRREEEERRRREQEERRRREEEERRRREEEERRRREEEERRRREEEERRRREEEERRRREQEERRRREEEERRRANINTNEYNVILKSSGSVVLAVVKAVKEACGYGLKEAKDLVDARPCTIKKGVSRSEAETIKSAIEECGGIVEIVKANDNTVNYYTEQYSNISAQEAYYMGENYFYGKNGKAQSYSEAVKYFTIAAEKGDKTAQANLGYCYDTGKGITQDHIKAVRWYSSAAEKGVRAAQFNLALCYEYAKGVKKDYVAAAYWYRKAAEQGHTNAQCSLGCCYEEGRGVTKDFTEAVKWYRKAAEQGYAKAQANLGYCYEQGNGVTKNSTEAIKLYHKAAEQGNSFAQNKLGYHYEVGEIVTKNIEEAVKWYRKSAEQGNKTAQYNLGLCYEYGKGVKKDINEANKWYKKAAEQGHENAKKRLK